MKHVCNIVLRHIILKHIIFAKARWLFEKDFMQQYHGLRELTLNEKDRGRLTSLSVQNKVSNIGLWLFLHIKGKLYAKINQHCLFSKIGAFSGKEKRVEKCRACWYLFTAVLRHFPRYWLEIWLKYLKSYFECVNYNYEWAKRTKLLLLTEISFASFRWFRQIFLS